MVYMGSKGGILEQIIPILESRRRSPDQLFVDAFGGGFNVVTAMSGPRWGNEYNHVIVDMFKYLQDKVYFDERTCEWCFPADTFPEEVSKEDYLYIRAHKDEYPSWLIAYVGFCCSFKATYFQGYAGKMYQDRNRASIYRQFTMKYHSGMRDVKLFSGDYRDLQIPEGSMVFLDPPYFGTAEYKVGSGAVNHFDHKALYEWSVDLVRNNDCDVYMTEYTAPNLGNWGLLWSNEKRNLMYSKRGSAISNIEKLFVCRG